MTQQLAVTVPAALRAELARRGVTKGGFARQIGHDETWLYRRLTGRTAFSLAELDQVLDELDVELVDLLAAEAAAPTPKKKTIAGRSTGRRSRTPNPQRKERR